MNFTALQRIKDFGQLVKFSHSVFLLPFALGAVVLASAYSPVTWGKVVMILIALVSARSAAMLMNRMADKRYDAINPRTKDRPSVSGRVNTAQAFVWLCAASGIFMLASAFLNELCLWLSPLALVWVLGYSFSKRFTVLCHLWLGAATALAPVGAWIAITGGFDWRVLVLAFSVTLWVAGFDVIYACQDIGFDREHKLSSLPARLGLKRALMLSRVMHAGAALGFLLLTWLFNLGLLYLAGAVIMAAVLTVEQVVVARKQANIPMAFFTLNGVVSILFFCFLLADRLLEIY